jgi:hypothetical protein
MLNEKASASWLFQFSATQALFDESHRMLLAKLALASSIADGEQLGRRSERPENRVYESSGRASPQAWLPAHPVVNPTTGAFHEFSINKP